jgi:arylsulfatase A-like enzyme
MKPRTAASLVPLIVVLACAAGCGAPAPPVSRVVVVTFDTTRADRLGCYGYEDAVTPNVDRFADGAVLFENVVSPVPTTLPSHSTIFTGLYPQDHGVRYNLVFRLGQDALTLAEVLGDAGFATAGIPATFILARKFGLDQGFDTYPEPPGGPGAMGNPLALNGVPAAEIVDHALAWIDEQADDGKFFLWVHFYDPHAPYAPPFPYSAEFRDRPYDGEIAYVDAQFGRLIDYLSETPRWEETLVLLAGDHGEGMYEHGERFHASLVYQSTVEVPLIVHAPGVTARRVTEPVGLVDVMPTVLDLAGIRGPANLRGMSLKSALDGGVVERRDLYFESLAGALNYGWAELKGVRYGDWKLIDSDKPELFDLNEDPGEHENLAGLEGDRLQELREALGRVAEPLEAATTAEVAHDPVLDAETEAFLASLGYVASGSGGAAAGAVHPREIIDLEPELLAAQSAVSAQAWDRLEEVCRYVLNRDPKNKFGLTNLVRALLWTERASEAQDHAKQLIELYPDNENGYALFARTYQAQGLTEQAHGVLVRGLEVKPESESLGYLALVAGFDLEQENVCSDGVPAAVNRHPESSRMRVLRARCQVRAGETEAAIETLREAVERGFRQFDRLEESGEFRKIEKLEAYAELVASVESEEDDRDLESID